MRPGQVHFILQGKGGVGKTFTSWVLAQHIQHKTGGVRPFDTDPVNDTLSQYRALQAKRIDILDQDNNFNARAFDTLVESVLAEDFPCVIDNGAATFVPLMAYLVENRVLELLASAGKRVYIHSVLAGGMAFDDTLQGLQAMLVTQSAPVVVWLNEFFGQLGSDGKPFLQSELYCANRERIRAVIRIQKGNPDTFGKDLELLGSHKLTFEQGIDSELFGIMPRQRIKMVRDALFAQLDDVDF